MKRLKTALPAMLLAVTLLAGCANPREFYEEVNDGNFSVKETVEEIREKVTDAGENLISGKGRNGKLAEFFSSLLKKEKEDPYAEFAKTREEKIVPFGEMEYSRPDIDVLREKVDAVEDALDEEKLSLSEIEELLDAFMDEYHNFSTMDMLADIRNCLDLTDEYYAEEYKWIGEQGPVVSDMLDELYYACGGSSYAKKLEKDYFWEGFAEEYANEEDSIYTPEFVELSQQESNLVSEYRDIIADPVITVNGKEVSYSEALAEAENKMTESMNAYLENQGDYGLYMEYYRDYIAYSNVLKSFYEQVGNTLAEIFIKLVKIRRDMAEEAGYDSVEEMEFDVFFDRDYTPEQSEEFIEAVEKYIVPLSDSVKEDLDFEYDDEIDVSPEKLESCLETVIAVMGDQFADAYKFMTEYDLYDFSSGPNKTPMSFVAYLNSYEAPYLLISPSGSVNDVLTAVHEFGHYTDQFGNYGANETIDLAECFSQGLELLSLNMLEDEIGRDAVKYLAQYKAKDIVTTYTIQCAFAEFERQVYALPENKLTVDNVNTIARDLAIRFGFMDRNVDDFYSYYWVDIPHFFESPFYVISYPVSCNVALQFYALERENEGAGIKKFNEMLGHESAYILETVEEYDMDSPFDSGSIKEVASLIKRMCKDFR